MNVSDEFCKCGAWIKMTIVIESDFGTSNWYQKPVNVSSALGLIGTCVSVTNGASSSNGRRAICWLCNVYLSWVTRLTYGRFSTANWPPININGKLICS